MRTHNKNHLSRRGPTLREICLRSACGLLMAASFQNALPAAAQIKPSFEKTLTSQKKAPLRAKRSKSKTGEKVYILNNGVMIPQQNSKGQTGAAHANGTVSFPGGTTVVPRGNSGTDLKENGVLVQRFPPNKDISRADIAQGAIRPSSPRGRPPGTGTNIGMGSNPSPGSSMGSLPRYIPDISNAGPESGGVSDIGSSGAGGSGVGSAGIGSSGAGSTSRPGSLIGGEASAGQTPRAEESTDIHGNPSYRLGNGQSVPQRVGTATGTPNGQGGVDYSDGRSVNVDQSTGETVFANPDGSEQSRSRPAQESMSSTGEETFTMSNGQQVPRTVNGSEGRPNGSGGVTYTDGRSTSVDPVTGESVFSNPDGSERTRHDAPRAYETQNENGESVFRMSNGATTPRTDRNGGVGRPNGYGGVDYPDGTSTRVTPDGRSVVHSPGRGTYITVTESEDDNGNAVFDLGNGTSVPVTTRGGQGRIAKGGSLVVFEDGMEIMVDGKTGNTVFIYPDGSSEATAPADRDAANAYVSAVDGSSSDSDDGDDNSGGSSSSNDNDNDDDTSSDDTDDSSDDSGSDDSGSSSEGETDGDTGSEGGSDEMRVDGGSTYGQHETKNMADTIVARKKGEGREVESVTPQPCGEGDDTPRPNAEPRPGEQSGCGPSVVGEDDEEEQPTTPSVADSLRLPEESVDGYSTVIQPGVGIERDRFNNDGRTLEDKLEDIDAVTNPQR